MDIDRDRLVQRMETYFDPSVSHDAMRDASRCAWTIAPGSSAVTTREYLQKRGFLPSNIVRHAIVHSTSLAVLGTRNQTARRESGEDTFPQVFHGQCLPSYRRQQNRREFDPAASSRTFSADRHVDRTWGECLSALFYAQPGSNHCSMPLPDRADGESQSMRRGTISRQSTRAKQESFYHTLAVLHAPAYRDENAGALRQDWPRVPLPDSRDALVASAALGRQIAALLDTETPVPGVTTATISARSCG